MSRLTWLEKLIYSYFVPVSRYHSYLNSATAILTAYSGVEPFASFLRKYFAANKKFGSRDRKTVSHLCYCYFRAGRLFNEDTIEDKILKSLFLCSVEPNEVLQQLKPEWNEKAALPPEEKYSLLSKPGAIENIFPWKEQVGEGIDRKQLASSFLIQPDLFLRIRPGYEQQVVQKLEATGINFNRITETCIALPNATKIEEVVELNKEAVVQDHSSQRVREFLDFARNSASAPSTSLRVWDCCAASGGKSILAVDSLGNIDLTVSDVRENILINLRKRFKEAGVTNYKSFVANLADPNLQPPLRQAQGSNFELIIADVPCTGSGTWSRTPEQLYFFDEKKIDHYADLQKKIIANVIRSLKPGGYLLYITCSVFKKENEQMIDYIEKEFHLQKMKMELLKGYDKKADTMFAALLQKS